jgi:hypothetical protein
MQVIEKIIAVIVIYFKIIAQKQGNLGTSYGNGSFPGVP